MAVVVVVVVVAVVDTAADATIEARLTHLVWNLFTVSIPSMQLPRMTRTDKTRAAFGRDTRYSNQFGGMTRLSSALLFSFWQKRISF